MSVQKMRPQVVIQYYSEDTSADYSREDFVAQIEQDLSTVGYVQREAITSSRNADVSPTDVIVIIINLAGVVLSAAQLALSIFQSAKKVKDPPLYGTIFNFGNMTITFPATPSTMDGMQNSEPAVAEAHNLFAYGADELRKKTNYSKHIAGFYDFGYAAHQAINREGTFDFVFEYNENTHEWKNTNIIEISGDI